MVLGALAITCVFLAVMLMRERRNTHDLCAALGALMVDGARLVEVMEGLVTARQQAPYCSCDVCQLIEIEGDEDGEEESE